MKLRQAKKIVKNSERKLFSTKENTPICFVVKVEYPKHTINKAYKIVCRKFKRKMSKIIREKLLEAYDKQLFNILINNYENNSNK